MTPVSCDTRFSFWVTAFGGVGNDDADVPTTGSEHKLIGGIACIDGIVIQGVASGAVGGEAYADLETNFDAQVFD